MRRRPVLRLSSLPISARLTLAFAAAMTIVLLVTGLWIFERQKTGYQESLSRSMRDRRGDIVALARARGTADDASVADHIVAADTGLLQVYDWNGDLLQTSHGLDNVRLASRSRVRAAVVRDRYYDFDAAPGKHHDVRVLLTLLPGTDLVVAFSVSQKASPEALEHLTAQLAFGGAVAVLFGSLLAFSLARAALRPVERLRQEAELHGRDDDDVSLEVPAARDEITRLAITLNELLARMREATLRERRFVAEAGHELRTPLATILAEIELAQEGAMTEAGLATLGSLHEEAVRLADLANQLLQLSTVGHEEQLERVDFGGVVERRVDRARTNNPNHTFRVAASRSVFVEVNANRLAQAIDNLLDNAALHGGATIDVGIELVATVGSSILDDAAVLHVRDDGTGITDAVAARAFERFSRADEARSRRGSGLGLSIVQAIAQGYGGTAGIARRTDGATGTDAWISLPVGNSI